MAFPLQFIVSMMGLLAGVLHIEATRIWRSKERAIFEKKLSMRLSQEPCLGVRTNSKRSLGGSASQDFCGG